LETSCCGFHPEGGVVVDAHEPERYVGVGMGAVEVRVPDVTKSTE